MHDDQHPAPAPRKVAFLGLGVMGGPMAGHLATAGHDVTVYNRTASRAEAWTQKHGHRHAATPREAAADADLVFACVGNDDDLRSVVLGDDGSRARSSSTTPPPRPPSPGNWPRKRPGAACSSSMRRSPAVRRAPRTAC